MNAMQEAFAKLGFRNTPRPATPEKQRRIEAAPNYKTFTDEELDAEIAALEEARIVITEEIQADLAAIAPKGEVWRRNAGRARAYKVAHLKLARDEYERRRPKAADLKAAAHAAWAARAQEVTEAKTREKEAERARAAALAEAAREGKAKAKAEADLVWQKRQARRARLFLMAADYYLTKEERAWLWDKAREMFPDDLAWR